jgi:flagellar basal body-associated protein FliL
MHGQVNILLVVAVSLLVLVLATGAGLSLRKWQATRARKIGVIVLCVIILAGGLGGTLFAYARPKAPPELSSKEKAALQKMYTAVTTNIPLFYDPLTRQDANYWNVGTWHQGDSCSFNDGAYHIISIEQEYYSWCIAEAPVFSNFVYQVRMKILRGDGGGLVFRAHDKSGDYYYFGIGQTGAYNLYRFSSKEDRQELQSGSSSSIKTGLNQVNLLSIVARGAQIAVFVNKQPIAEINDSTYQKGQIGLAADEDNNTTDVAYTNAQVWTL